MSDRRMEGPGEHRPAVPRDMPDQQAGPGPDPLDVGTAGRGRDEQRDDDEQLPGTGTDTDGAGARRRGRPDRSEVDPEEQPVPEEPSD